MLFLLDPPLSMESHRLIRNRISSSPNVLRLQYVLNSLGVLRTCFLQLGAACTLCTGSIFASQLPRQYESLSYIGTTVLPAVRI
jgi:hypothetical protein